MQEAFQVATEQPSYWRLMALDTFDGEIWKLEGSFTGVAGDLPLTAAPITTGESVVDTFTITGLSSIWLPAAFAPVRISGGGNIGFDVESATLITDRESAEGAHLPGDVGQATSAAGAARGKWHDRHRT